jgi:hypothetical protein
MKHRIILALLLTTVMTVINTSAAQSTKKNLIEDERVAEARALMQAGRDEIVAEEMELSETEAERFWPLYRSYRADVMAVQDRYASMIGGYLDAYEAGEISDEYAKKLLEDWLDFRKDLLQVKQHHVRKFRKALPIRKVVRFYQLENKMDAEIDVELARFVPLMDAL